MVADVHGLVFRGHEQPGVGKGHGLLQWDDTAWYRSSRWDVDIAAEFEKRLSRARQHNRPQYLRIQALHLTGQEDPTLRAEGRHLFQRVIDDYADVGSVEVKSAMEQLGDSYFADGLLDDAERTLLLTLDRIEESDIGRSATSHLTELTLADVMLARGDNASLTRAVTFLELAQPQVDEQSPMFRNTYFRYLLAYARVASALGLESAKIFAELALGVAGETDPPIPRHPELGLPRVTAAHRLELEGIARGSAGNRAKRVVAPLLRALARRSR